MFNLFSVNHLVNKFCTHIRKKLSSVWVGRFCPLVSNFMQSHVVCGSPRHNMGNYQIVLLLVQKPVRATQYFQKNPRGNFFFSFRKMFSLMPMLYSKKIKKLLPSSHTVVEHNFLEFPLESSSTLKVLPFQLICLNFCCKKSIKLHNFKQSIFI